MKRGFQTGFIALVFLLLIFPLCGGLLPEMQEDGLKENRALATFPTEGSLQERIQGVEAYLSDHLALREAMIHAVLRLDLLLGETPDSQVILGKGDWLYFAQNEADIRRTMTLDPLDADMVIEAQTAARDTLQSHDIAYMVLIGPDKHSIYPEHLPLSCRLGQGPSMLDQIFSVMAENQLPFSDPRAALLAAKEAAPTDLYWHTDTHWNELGDWVTYNHLMDSLAPIAPTLHRVQDEDFTATPCDFSGDLAGMIGMAGIYVEKTMTCAFHDEAQIQVDGSLCNEMFTVYRNHALPEGPTVVLRHDSFGEAIIPFLARSAGLLYTTTSEELPLPAILEAQADLVLVEYVERDALGLGNGISEEEW